MPKGRDEKMRCRYGPVPEALENLIDTSRLRRLWSEAGEEFSAKVGGNILLQHSPGRDFTSSEPASPPIAFG